MTSDPKCKFSDLLKNLDPGALGLMLTAGTLTEHLGHTFNPEAFGMCDCEGQAVTLAHLDERKLTVCKKHANAMLLLSGKPLPLYVKKTRPVSGGYSASEMAGEFPGLRPWSHTPEQDGDRSLTWRTAMLSSADRRLRKKSSLLSSLCGRCDYRDGLKDEGVSPFEAESASGVGAGGDNTTGSRNGARAGRGGGFPPRGEGGPPGDSGEDDADDHDDDDHDDNYDDHDN